MKNVMKKLLALASLLVLALFVGCSDLADSKNTADGSSENKANAKVCLVSGKVSIGGSSGATSSNLLAPLAKTASDARSATSSLSNTFGTVKTELAIEAINDSFTVSGEIASDGSYSLALTSAGEWTLRASQWMTVDDGSGGVLNTLDGSVTIEVSEDYEAVTQDIVVTPSFHETVKGSINLTITDSSTNSKIKSLTYAGTVPEGHKNSLLSPTTVNFSNGTATISAEDVFPNNYDVTFSFYDAADGEGNLLYKCKETVTVFSGYETDTWLGASPYMKKNTDGSYTFEITDELISNFGTEIVAASKKVLLYEYESTEIEGSTNERNNYYLVDEDKLGTEEETSSRTALMESAFTSYLDDFSDFDSEGNIYILSGTTLYSNKTGWPAAGLNESALGLDDLRASSKYDGDIRGFVIDRKTDDAYLIHDKNGVCVVKWPKLISSSGSDKTMVTFTLNSSEIYLPQQSVVYDGKFYLLSASSSSQTGYIRIFDAKDAVEGADDFQAKNVPFGLPSYSIKITDMLYQDGAVYLLAREVYTDTQNFSSFNSRGAVIRYDTFFDSVMQIGYSATSNSTSDLESAKLGAYYNSGLICNEENLASAIYVPCNHTWTYYGTSLSLSGSIPTFYTPSSFSSSLSQSAFYGPVKFVAIKPKKLVIADDGLAFYVDSDDVLKYKNVNRIVTVDLESLSIISTTSTKASLESDSSDVIPCFKESTSTTYQGALTGYIPTSTIFYHNGTDFISWEPSTYNTVLGIPCGD